EGRGGVGVCDCKGGGEGDEHCTRDWLAGGAALRAPRCEAESPSLSRCAHVRSQEVGWGRRWLIPDPGRTDVRTRAKRERIASPPRWWAQEPRIPPASCQAATSCSPSSIRRRT